MQIHQLDELARGVFIISVTPFDDRGELDLPSVDPLIEFYLERGVAGITVLGMMGEAPKLSPDESLSFLTCVLGRVAGRVPVVVGVSNPGLDNLVRLARQSMDLGAAGVMVAPVPNLAPDDRVRRYFEQVFAALGEAVPVVYQDYPFATRSPISVPAFNRMVAEFPQLVMLKHEEWPGLNKLTEVRQSAAGEGLRRVSILVGNGGLYLPQELDRGADGAMTGFAYPEMLVEVVRLHQEGRSQEAEDLYDLYLPLLRHEQQPGFGLAVRKEILFRRGAIGCPAVRAPGPRLNSTDHDELSRLIDRLERNLRET